MLHFHSSVVQYIIKVYQVPSSFRSSFQELSPSPQLSSKIMTDPDILESMKLDLLDMDIILNNVVATFSLGNAVKLDLIGLVLRGINIEMRGGKGYAQIKLRNPSATANVYASGKVTVCGAKSEVQAKVAARKFARIIQKVVQKQPKICTKPGGQDRICVKNYKVWILDNIMLLLPVMTKIIVDCECLVLHCAALGLENCQVCHCLQRGAV